MKGKYPSVIFVLVLLLSAITNYPDVAALTIKVGYPQLSGGTMPLWVINDAKLDRRYGVDISSIYVPGGARLTQSLIAGDVDIALTGGAVVTADLSGADLTYIAIGLSTYGFYVYTKPDIKEVRDLGGAHLRRIAEILLMQCDRPGNIGAARGDRQTELIAVDEIERPDLCAFHSRWLRPASSIDKLKFDLRDRPAA